MMAIDSREMDDHSSLIQDPVTVVHISIIMKTSIGQKYLPFILVRIKKKNDAYKVVPPQ